MSAAEIITTIIVALFAGGGMSAVIQALVARRKAGGEIRVMNADAEKKDAETTDIIVQAAGRAADMLSKQLCYLIDQNNAMKAQIDRLMLENDSLKSGQQRHEKEIAELQTIVEMFDEVLTGAHVLYDQVVSLQAEPQYKPPARRKK